VLSLLNNKNKILPALLCNMEDQWDPELAHNVAGGCKSWFDFNSSCITSVKPVSIQLDTFILTCACTAVKGKM
jgi:hypothetical protein